MTIRTAIAGAVLAAAAVATAACSDSPTAYTAGDCDAEDLAHYEDDCGYWDTGTGTFVFWYWVSPTYGGYRPAGWTPYVPPGGSTQRPPNARTASPRVQPKPPNAPKYTPPPTVTVPKYTPPAKVQPAPKAPAPKPRTGK